MSHDSDRFISEVTEEMRRERMGTFLRKYGWIGILLVLVVVGGTAWREYSNIRANNAAQAWGDAVLSAMEQPEPEAALMAVDPQGSDTRAALSGLLAASVAVQRDADADVAPMLDAAAQSAGSDPVLQDLARLKAVIAAGGAMAPDQRDAVLAELAAQGRPFRLLALEQQAIALIEAGREEDALTLIRQIQAEADVSSGLRRRLSEMMISLGGPMDEAISGMAGLPQTATMPPLR
ncbi:MAG: hypothetical protein Q4G36_07850 [Paracoccus sp. (in: a-proteobacteria)]|nr:hypothetical protein [Paracoccus sp. (in: a-proteobacteria)]